ncbi:hypothetical protein Agub_g13336 [Astrephomene gubernaculifera]|uniref:Uncharacterized protein n=1 Tax=Astrephomene gubernaculifera TaxID=47775 RepID=A0AAD3E1N9_9CHLO|nr:hypothetical protein Agub_g13336 [Astrephomene gubernaculifera]
MEYVLHARVPLIKFTDRRSGIAVDLCLGSPDTGFKAWSVAQVASIHPAFGKLFRVVKVWAKAHAINDGAAHMFNSWCLTLVVIFFLQRCELLPPLHALLYDKKPDVEAPRIMQGGEKELAPQVYEVMRLRAEQAAQLYGGRPCRPLSELFRDFVAESGRKLRALLASQEVFKRGTRMSAFFGELLAGRPFLASYVLCVEDPYDDSDNTARTFGTWEGNPGTIHYVTSVFERTLKHLDLLLSGASSSAAAPPSLAATLAFLFGPELLSRLPHLSPQLLGPQLDEWAREAVRAGRPAGEVHEGMLRRLGAADEFVSFQSFKRRHNIKVFNEDKYATPEEKAAAAEIEAARKAAKRAKDAEKRAAKKAREQAERGGRQQQQQQPPPPAAMQPPQQEGLVVAAEASAAAAAALTTRQVRRGAGVRDAVGKPSRG